MLKLKNINVQIDNKLILNNFNLKINKGEIHVIMGPNGAGKSTLSSVIMGNPGVSLTKGDILFEDVSIKKNSVDQRAKKGIFLAFQYPPQLEGITNLQFLKAIIHKKLPLFELYQKIENEKKILKMPDDYLRREVNTNFSGGEKKRNEIMQMKMLNPKLIILDEIDSGLDVDSLKLVMQEIKKYFNREVSILIITHYSKVVKYLKPDYVHIMKNGQLVKTGDISLAEQIEEFGYGDN